MPQCVNDKIIEDSRISILYDRDTKLYESLPDNIKSTSHLLLAFPFVHQKRRLNELNVLNWIEKNSQATFDKYLILKLYDILTLGTDLEKSRFKTSVINIYNGESLVYVTASPEDTEKEIDLLCKRYSHLNQANPEHFEDIFRCTLEFICIHPMSDGNGRMSVLLKQFLLYKFGLKCATLIPLDAVQKVIYGEANSVAIRKASGVFYGQKPYAFRDYSLLMMDILEKSYDYLELAKNEAINLS